MSGRFCPHPRCASATQAVWGRRGFPQPSVWLQPPQTSIKWWWGCSYQEQGLDVWGHPLRPCCSDHIVRPKPAVSAPAPGGLHAQTPLFGEHDSVLQKWGSKRTQQKQPVCKTPAKSEELALSLMATSVRVSAITPSSAYG